MAKPDLQLRLFQGGCMLFIVLCILLLHLGVLGSLEPAGREIRLVQLLIIVGAAWSAVVGFTFQRKLSELGRNRHPLLDGRPDISCALQGRPQSETGGSPCITSMVLCGWSIQS